MDSDKLVEFEKELLSHGRIDDYTAQKNRIIAAAYDIGSKQGLSSISARGVARKAGVSVGYLYKLFPSKSDIMVAAAEQYFDYFLFKKLCHVKTSKTYVEYCRKFWKYTKSAVTDFKHTWLKDQHNLPKSDLIAAQNCMNKNLARTRKWLEIALEQDKHIEWQVLAPKINAASIIEFTMQSFLESLKKDEADCEILFILLERSLYNIT